MDKHQLRLYAKKYEIEPVEDQFGNWGLRKVQVRKLHNFIYKEQENGQADGSVNRGAVVSDPWA